MESIALTDAIADPGAMMVVRGDTVVAGLAVLAPQRLFNMTNSAIFILNEKHHVLVVLLIVFWETIINLNNHIGNLLDAIVEGGWRIQTRTTRLKKL